MFGAGSGDPLQREPGGVLTMFPLVASPSSPPNVMTGDMQAQYRKRTDATHCRLTASFTSLHRNGTFLLTSFTRPPKILQEVPVSSPPKHVRRSPERRSPARPLELWPRVMLRLLHRLRVVGGAVRLCRDLPLLLRKRTGVCFQHRCAGRVQVRPGSPETGRSWGVRCGCWGPTPLEAARSPDPETRRSRTGGRSGPWPCTPRHGRSGTQEKGVKRRQQGGQTAGRSAAGPVRTIYRLLPVLTSSVISVAMDRPISWYCGPFPNGPSSRKRNLDQKTERQHLLGGGA